MNRYVLRTLAFSILLSTTLGNAGRVDAQHGERGHGGGQAQSPPPQQQAWQRQQQMQQEQQSEQQQHARQQQELAVRNQEEQARQAQQAARAQEQAARSQQNSAQRQNLESARQAQEQQQRQAQDQNRIQQEAARQAQEQNRIQQEAARQAQEQNRIQQEAARQAQEQQNRQAREQNRIQQNIANQQTEAALFAGHPFVSGLVRPFLPAPLTLRTVPLEKAILMPVLDAAVTEEERAHADQVEQCLREHLVALPSPPPDYAQVQSNVLNTFLGNYQTNVLGQSVTFNPQDTYVTTVPTYEYPTWWHPAPGWIFSNGFTLGGAVNVGLDWLRWGWHPYYGPPPDGFVCAANYVPTPVIYFPAYGLWRVAGISGWASSGPSVDYTGPISVEVLEHRKATILDPYTGRNVTKIINVPYLYNGFYFPEYGRWGYTNRHGYFILINP